MMIQSTDGFFYRNPVILGHRWVLFVEDDYVLIARKGRVVWSTTKRPLARAGVRCSLTQALVNRKVIIDGAYTNCSIFKIKLSKPISPPNEHQGRTSMPEGEILLWK